MGNNGKSGGGKGVANRRAGKGAGKTWGRPVIGKFARRTKLAFAARKGTSKGSTKGRGKGKWVFVPAGKKVKGKGKGKGKHQGKGGKSCGPPKAELMGALSMLLKRSATKDDCVYELSEEDGKHKCLLKISALDTECKEFQGKPAEDENAAKANACRGALKGLSAVIKEARKGRAAVQEEKRKEFKTKRNEKRKEFAEEHKEQQKEMAEKRKNKNEAFREKIKQKKEAKKAERETTKAAAAA